MTETRKPLLDHNGNPITDEEGDPVYARNVVCMSRTCGNYRIVIPVPDNGSTVHCGGSGAHPLMTVEGDNGPEVVEDREITPDPANPVPDVLPPDPDPLPEVPDEDAPADGPEPEVA